MVLVDVDSLLDPDEDIFSDIEGLWEDGGNWEEFDHSGVSLFSFNQWKAFQNKNVKRIRKDHYCILKRRKTITRILSAKPEFEAALKKFIKYV